MRSGPILPLQIDFDAPPAVRDALARMGRTEDVRLAPSGKRLAIACYARGRIAVADLELDVSSSPPAIAVTSFDELSSSTLSEPHGIDFADDDTLVVAARAGSLAVFALPPAGAGDGMTASGAPRMLDTAGSPGSVAVVASDSSRREVLVCNNWESTVTRHALDGNGAAEVVVRKWLDLPDGVTVSRDGQWLAVSNHNSHTVLVYRYVTLNEHADPLGILRGVHYPHGLRFGPDDGHLLVADAGAPHVHVFAQSDGNWHGARYPTATIRVMDDDTFARGRHNAAEGGPKGIDVHPHANVLVVTSECLPLAFFDLMPVLDGDELVRADDSLVGYELLTMADTERTRAEASEARALLAEFQHTTAWRLIQPVQRAYGAAVRLMRRRAG